MKTKNRMRKAGFTLVELIVVIAVLGILGAGAAVGYSGYVKKAAKAADEQLVSQIKYALEVAYVADPSYSGAAAVVLSKDADANVTGEADSAAVRWVSNAMTNAFGANWKNELKLEYGQWGNAASVTGDVLDYYGGITDAGIKSIVNGTAKPSFAGDVDDLFVQVRDTSKKVAGKTEGSGAALIQSAANLTTKNFPGDEGKKSPADFATAWATRAWSNDILMGTEQGSNYNEGKIEENKKGTDDASKNFMANAVANAAVLKARNTALAVYLRDAGYPEVYKAIADYTFVNSSIPDDVVGVLLYEENPFNADNNAKVAKKNGLCNCISDALKETYPDETIRAGKVDLIADKISSYFNADSGNSQAYKDGLAYFTMMSTINNINGTSTDDNVYWDEMAGAVSLYGSIARGEASLDQLKDAFAEIGENQVAITAAVGKTGLGVYVNPKMILDAQ